jgi:hypothetical protein
LRLDTSEASDSLLASCLHSNGQQCEHVKPSRIICTALPTSQPSLPSLAWTRSPVVQISPSNQPSWRLRRFEDLQHSISEIRESCWISGDLTALEKANVVRCFLGEGGRRACWPNTLAAFPCMRPSPPLAEILYIAQECATRWENRAADCETIGLCQTRLANLDWERCGELILG